MRTRLLAAAALAALAAALAALAAAFPVLTITSIRGGLPRSTTLAYAQDPSEHPRLQLLRRRERLDAVIAGGATELEKIVALRRWAKSQWKESPDPFYYPAWDAVEIIDLARKRGNRAFCAQYAIVFLQACRSVGIQARYVNLGHFLTEAWSNELNRWVVMDPTNDIHFERGGVPLDGLALMAATKQDNADGILKVGSDGSRTPAAAADIAPYANYSVMLRSDQLTKPIEVATKEGIVRLPVQVDYRRYPVVGRDVLSYVGDFLVWETDKSRIPYESIKPSGDPADFLDAFNQTLVEVSAKDARAGTLTLRLKAEHAPDFAGFQVAGGGATRFVTGNEAVVPLKTGMNEITARVKTKYGWVGPPGVVKVLYKPGWPRF